MNGRLHNFLTAAVIGIVFGVTAWSLWTREPALFAFRMEPAASTAQESAPPRGEPAAAERASVTEQMIERGALSKEPARFVRPADQNPPPPARTP